ncbi:hypothetical protein IG631_22451 [Alternaria alternata]|nr:hypothetical protein IG631_22451 [Alternaria alternata]
MTTAEQLLTPRSTQTPQRTVIRASALVGIQLRAYKRKGVHCHLAGVGCSLLPAAGTMSILKATRSCGVPTY